MKDISIINKFFTQNNFSKMLKKDYSNNAYDYILSNIIHIDNKDDLDNLTAINKIYYYMSKYYRNEYFYQNTLFNKLLLGKHSLNTTTAIAQLPINKSIADYIMINGKAIVYEIKTELDSFERLRIQLQDYQKAFNNICVVTCENNYKKLYSILSSTNVGICVLTNRNTLQFRKEIIENNSDLDYRTIFNILRKKEFETILLNYFEKLPNTKQVEYYDACFEMIKLIPIEIFYSKFIKQLKLRNRIDKQKFNQVPYELKSLVYFSNGKKINYYQLKEFLSDNIGG
jgi:hypothetical protein